VNLAQQNSSKFRPDIEGLRGVAVLLVVLYHCGIQPFRGGYVGVDVFFVISGYLITGLIADEIRSNGRVDFIGFYARRARRILPAASLVAVVIALVSSQLYAPWNLETVLKAGFASSLWVGNLYFVRIALDYLAEHARHSPYLHMWSLGVEEQFYLVWPMLLNLFIAPERRTHRLTPILVLGSLTLASVIACVLLTRTHQPWAFFMLPCRAWEFAIGGIAQLYAPKFNRSVQIVFHLLGLGGLVASASLFSETTAFPGYAAMLPTAASAFVLISGDTPRGLSWALQNRGIRIIGRLSYSWYLWHWPVLILGAQLFGRLGIVQSLGGCLLALLLALATYEWVEKPLRYSPIFVRNKWRTARTGLLTAGVCAAFCLLVLNFSVHHLNAAESELATELEKLPIVYTDGCHLDFQSSSPLPCVFGDQQSSRTVVLMGDSHAASLFPAIEQVAVEQHLRLISMTKSSCPISNIATYDPALHRQYEECDRWRQNAIQKAIAIRPDFIILSEYTSYYIPRSPGPGIWAAALRATLEQLDSAQVQTYLVHDPPVPNPQVIDCLFWKSRFNADPHTCTYPLDRNADLSISNIESQAALGLFNIRLLNLNQFICARGPCPLYSKGIPIYRDDHHLSVDFSRSLAPIFSVLLTHGNNRESHGSANLQEMIEIDRTMKAPRAE
jgi:peptidoglycan/LPS O-acetylase OafA/YrhL